MWVSVVGCGEGCGKGSVEKCGGVWGCVAVVGGMGKWWGVWEVWCGVGMCGGGGSMGKCGEV